MGCPQAVILRPGNDSLHADSYESPTAALTMMAQQCMRERTAEESVWCDGVQIWWQHLSTCVEANAVEEHLKLMPKPISRSVCSRAWPSTQALARLPFQHRVSMLSPRVLRRRRFVVDKPRFLMDPEYRRQSCLELACTASVWCATALEWRFYTRRRRAKQKSNAIVLCSIAVPRRD